MRILVFDTETSGLNPQWNVILQLSYQIVDSDSWATKKTVNHYFAWPEDRSRVTQEAINVNGLTERSWPANNYPVGKKHLKSLWQIRILAICL